ncbi:hypothetical protein OPAG_05405 [Rhodococcus opacus PD630]|nr:hypothetical protein Pd630_LPD04894 [Rhodococcus opacus PD630]EHI45374.1 hypothetical protein OPAG_05405 [Rhodococcus opacus PD630]
MTGHVGTLTVDVRAWGRPALPCVAGAVDRRDTRPDGTVLDLLDTCRAADAPHRRVHRADDIGADRIPATTPELDLD